MVSIVSIDSRSYREPLTGIERYDPRTDRYRRGYESGTPATTDASTARCTLRARPRLRCDEARLANAPRRSGANGWRNWTPILRPSRLPFTASREPADVAGIQIGRSKPCYRSTLKVFLVTDQGPVACLFGYPNAPLRSEALPVFGPSRLIRASLERSIRPLFNRLMTTSSPRVPGWQEAQQDRAEQGAKDGLLVGSEIEKFAELGWEQDETDLQLRLKWYGMFGVRKRQASSCPPACAQWSTDLRSTACGWLHR